MRRLHYCNFNIVSAGNVIASGRSPSMTEVVRRRSTETSSRFRVWRPPFSLLNRKSAPDGPYGHANPSTSIATWANRTCCSCFKKESWRRSSVTNGLRLRISD